MCRHTIASFGRNSAAPPHRIERMRVELWRDPLERMPGSPQVTRRAISRR